MTRSPMEFGAVVARAADALRRDEPLIRKVEERLFAEPLTRRVKRGPRSARRLVPVVAAGAAVCLLLYLAWAVFSTAPIGLAVEGKRVARPEGVFVEAKEAEPKHLVFSDGSSVTLSPATSARVVATTAKGARILVERGAAHAEIVHLEETDWRFDIGPFSIQVTGTVFDVTWRPDQGFFSVALEEGSVEVEGPTLSKARSVGAGETLRAWTRTGKTELLSGDHETARSVSSKPAPRSAPKSARAAETPTAPAFNRGDNEPDAPVARKHRDEALLTETRDDNAALSDETLEAETTGAKTTPHHEDMPAAKRPPALINRRIAPITPETTGPAPSELLQRGDRERLARDFEAAKQTYLEVRRRFGGSQAAAMAAFSLGRMSFDHERDYARAAEWFQTFLVEHQGKTLRREALGRLMESFYKAGNRKDAARAATQYLHTYPDGPHAALARSIIDE